MKQRSVKKSLWGYRRAGVVVAGGTLGCLTTISDATGGGPGGTVATFGSQRRWDMGWSP